MAIAGKVAITLSTENGGAWSADVTYDRLVAVKHNNNLYISRKVVTNVEPPNDEFWFLALEGYSGKDVQSLIDSMNDIITGTTQVGNAKTLDGNGVSYFAKDSDLVVERERISNLARLNEGSTTGDAELVDIRVGANGETYTNAGDAVRNQITELKSDLVNVSDEINNLNFEVFGQHKINYSFTKGRYIENGYNMSRTTECVNDGYIEKGVYDFPTPPSGMEFSIYYYDSDTQGILFYYWTSNAKNRITIEKNAKINFRKSDLSMLSDADVDKANGYSITKYNTEIEKPVFATGVDENVLVGLYFPNLESGWTVERIRAKSDMYRLGIKLADGTLIIDGLSNVGTSYSDAVHTFVNKANGQTIGYYVLHYNGNDYEVDNKQPTEEATSLVNNSIISEYLNREENLVLIGDSIFGFETQNELAPLLRKRTNKKVYNCGFGGCRMALESENSAYNPLTFVGVADAIESEDFSAVWGASSLQNIYPFRYADLVSVDFTKPTTILVNYGNNDITAGNPIGNYWKSTDSESSWDKYSLLGAMNYGFKKIIEKYPHIRIIFLTPVWRYMENVPFFEYTNSSEISANSYRESILENGKRLGVSVYDMTTKGGRNNYNRFLYMIDGTSHYTIKGYEKFAEVIKSVSESDLH